MYEDGGLSLIVSGRWPVGCVLTSQSGSAMAVSLLGQRSAIKCELAIGLSRTDFVTDVWHTRT